MGMGGSWAGFPAIGKEQLLRELGLEETSSSGDVLEVTDPVSLAEMPNGSLILYSNDYDWASPDRIVDLSRLGMVVGCQFEDHVMVSACSAAKQGRILWHVSHDPEEGVYDLQRTGRPPAEFETIRLGCIAEQDAEGGEEADTDILFDAPLLLAKQICGLKYDDESSEVRFAKLRLEKGGWAAQSFRRVGRGKDKGRAVPPSESVPWWRSSCFLLLMAALPLWGAILSAIYDSLR